MKHTNARNGFRRTSAPPGYATLREIQLRQPVSRATIIPAPSRHAHLSPSSLTQGELEEAKRQLAALNQSHRTA